MWKESYFAKSKYRPRILICDPKKETRVELFNYLSSLGFHIDQAMDGDECINLACKRFPDVILLDYEAQKTSGIDTMRSLRNLGINTPVLLFSSGMAEPFDKDSAVLPKMLEPKEVALILETMLFEIRNDKYFVPWRLKIN